MTDLSLLPGISLHENEPVFNEPWEAQAFGIVIALHDNEVFSWDEWVSALVKVLNEHPNEDYYKNWLSALENIVDSKKLISFDTLSHRKALWHEAAAQTPHGEPIQLPSHT